MVQPLFERIDSLLSSWTFEIWPVVPPFQLRHALAASNVFAYVCVALFIGTIGLRNQAWGKLDDHTRAQRDVEQERMRPRYRDAP